MVPSRPARSRAEAGVPSEGLPANLIEFFGQLRDEGVPIGTAELLDAFNAIESVSWEDRSAFKEALATCVAKGQRERWVFDLLFERFFFRASEAAAAEQGISEERHIESELLALDDISDAITKALHEGSDGDMRDLARLAIAAFGREGEGSGVVGVDVQRIRRGLGLRRGRGTQGTDHDQIEIPDESLKRFEKYLRQELERAQIDRTGELPPAKPLAELDRALPTSPTQDLAAVHRVVSQLKRSLATVGHEARGHSRSAHVDIRRTMRASLETGGVPLRLKFRPRRPRRPEIFVLCDVSTSVSSASVFFLSVLHALHDAFRKLRSFVFVERISEVTDVFERERDFRTVSEMISKKGGIADDSGYTDYGRVWLEFFNMVSDDLHPRSTIIVLGDARTNGREPHADTFSRISEHAGRTFWLNPEPRLYWNYGDSVISTYEPHCTRVIECWTTTHLEEFVRVIARGTGFGEKS